MIDEIIASSTPSVLGGNRFFKKVLPGVLRVLNVRLSTAHLSFFKYKVSFSSKFGSFFSVIRENFSVLFRLKLYMLLTKVAQQSENFQTCHCAHWNSLNSSCHFWNEESVFLQTLPHSSLSWEITLVYNSILFHLNICVL